MSVMEFVFQTTGSGQIGPIVYYESIKREPKFFRIQQDSGPICPRRKIWESHGSHFLVLKSSENFVLTVSPQP